MNLFENYLNKVVNKKSEDFTIDDIKPGMWVLLKKEDQLIKNASVGKHWQHEQMLGRWQYVNKIDTKNNLVGIVKRSAGFAIERGATSDFWNIKEIGAISKTKPENIDYADGKNKTLEDIKKIENKKE